MVWKVSLSLIRMVAESFFLPLAAVGTSLSSTQACPANIGSRVTIENGRTGRHTSISIRKREIGTPSPAAGAFLYALSITKVILNGSNKLISKYISAYFIVS